MIRVNHAGEFGATRIYAGQRAILGEHDPTLAHMHAQEQEHLKAFQKMVIERGVRPSILQPLWYVGGFAMGAISALISREAAHACTIAVEEVIDDHYATQEASLADENDPELKTLISQCRADELAHKETAIVEGGLNAPAYPLLTGIIKTITKTAIQISKRV
jgi:ubiquinone biosynthesis monooxygenase Coq7